MKRLVEANRSVRRFKQNPAPTPACLEELVDLARLTPSANNLQPLRYVLVQEEGKRDQVFSCLAWAAHLTTWEGPQPNERPTAYIIILSDPRLNKNPGIDVGIVTQTILLGARERGYGGCALGSVNRDALRRCLDLPVHLNIELAIALGAPGEEIRLCEVKDGDTRYRRDENDAHIVPKRPLTELILKSF